METKSCIIHLFYFTKLRKRQFIKLYKNSISKYNRKEHVISHCKKYMKTIEKLHKNNLNIA